MPLLYCNFSSEVTTFQIILLKCIWIIMNRVLSISSNFIKTHKWTMPWFSNEYRLARQKDAQFSPNITSVVTFVEHFWRTKLSKLINNLLKKSLHFSRNNFWWTGIKPIKELSDTYCIFEWYNPYDPTSKSFKLFLHKLVYS